MAKLHVDLPFLSPLVSEDEAHISCDDVLRVPDLARYYLAHPEHGYWQREPVLEETLTCFDRVLCQGIDTPEMHQLMRQVVTHAIGDTYDRDCVRVWHECSTPTDPCLLSKWIKANFPGYLPVPSIWEEMSQQQHRPPT